MISPLPTFCFSSDSNFLAIIFIFGCMKKKKCNIRHVIIALLFLSSYLIDTGLAGYRLYQPFFLKDPHQHLPVDSGQQRAPGQHAHTEYRRPQKPCCQEESGYEQKVDGLRQILEQQQDSIAVCQSCRCLHPRGKGKQIDHQYNPPAMSFPPIFFI